MTREIMINRAKELESEMVGLFKEFHRHPELSSEEFRTTERIRERLVSWGIEILPVGLKTGVVGLLRGERPGPCIALRADIDALPICEASGLDYASEEAGRMHACGHDSHIVMLLYAARLLSEFRSEIEGSVKFVFQPAEETGGGASAVIAAGGLENPHVDAIFGVHNYPLLNVGEAALFHGPVMAAVHWFKVTVIGVGAHGGMPQRGKDPVVAAAAMIQALQTIVSRSTNPLDACVVTVSSILSGDQAGEDGKAFLTKNVIPKYCRMGGTCRCYSDEVEEHLQERFERVIRGIAHACDVDVEIAYDRAHPVTRNHPDLYERAQKAAGFAGLKVIETEPSTAGEDFAVYGTKIPSFLYWIGSGTPETDRHYAWHSPKFTADPRCLYYGALNFTFTILNGLE